MGDGQEFSAALDLLWSQVLEHITEGDWRRAERELRQKIGVLRRLAPKSGSASLSVEPHLIVLASMQQKFGNLGAAKKTLKQIGNPSAEAGILKRVVESRVLSQSGLFREAHEVNLELVSLVGRSSPTPEIGPSSKVLESMPSLAWRTAMTAGLTGEMKLSDYWFNAHRDVAVATHSSQLANNEIFASVVSLARKTANVHKIHESNLRAIEGYLQDGLSTSGVLFLSLAKSIAVPLALEGVLLLRYGQKHDALVQALLARRLLEYSRIQARSEGLAELVYALSGSQESLCIDIIRRSSMDSPGFQDWFVNQTGDPWAAHMALGEAEERFQEFRTMRQHRVLFIVRDVFPSVVRGSGGRTACFFWGGRAETGWRIRSFLVEDLGLRVLGFGAREIDGLSRLKALDLGVAQAEVAVVHIHQSLEIELGAAYNNWKSKRVVYLSTEEGDMGLALSSLRIDEDVPDSSFHQLRRMIQAALAT